MTPADPWSNAPGWRDFFDLLSDAIVVLDAQARVVMVNTAALRLLPCEAGASLDQLKPALGSAATQWLKRAATGSFLGTAAPLARLADGRSATMAWRRLDAQHSVLRLSPTRARAAEPAPGVPNVASVREALALFWESPFPASLQGPDFRLIDVNQAMLDYTGFARDQLIGQDPQQLMPPEDQAAYAARRERLQASPVDVNEAGLKEARLFDASGRERRYRVARRTLRGDDGEPLYLAVLQDATAEHLARERADRSLRELDDWFDLSPVGMVLFDASGLLLRTNPAFDTLAGAVPVSLADAGAGLQQLLAWDDRAVSAQLLAGATALQRQGSLKAAPGGPRLLRSVVRGYNTSGGQRRYMAVVEDRSVEEERDLAQMQIGALMDTAGVGLATFQDSGWLPQGRAPRSEHAGSAALESIGRDIVVPESLPEFEKLQAALRRAQRAEVRYAINHPELGRRWLLTRVEPARLASGKRTSSVVTLDITEQHQSQLRSEQLLHELSTILESTTAGIAYLRGDALQRCNRRFELMLGWPEGAALGLGVQALFAHNPQAARIAADAEAALADSPIFETEFDVPAARGEALTRWYSLSLRRTGETGGTTETIAVLSDVTRLKTQQRELEILARDRELMFSLSGVGIAFIRGRLIQRANQALAHLAGCTVDELSLLDIAELFADRVDFEHLWPQEEAELRSHGRWTGERQLRLRDGRLRWVQVSKRLVTQGDVAGGIIASYVDVDARHRAERAVALQADRTRSILDSALVGIVTVGPQGIEWMNRSARRMFAGELADFVNLPISTVATPEPEHPFRRTQYLTELVEGQAQTFECRVLARDGREFWVVGNAVSTERESTGRQLTYALLDIERRRLAEARVTEAQASLQRIIEAAPLAITLYDAHTLKIVQINEVAARATGHTPPQLVGAAPEDIVTPEFALALRHDMAHALGSTEVTTREYPVLIDGEATVWDARYLPLSAGPGRAPDQLLLVATDVTEQRAAQEARLEAAIAQREMLVKEVHHRIKNNLQGVAGLLQQIGQRKPEVAGVIAEVVGQVHAIAQVYGLQVGSGGPLQLASVVEAITASVQRTFGRTIRFVAAGSTPSEWTLPEAESIPIALTLNELLTNAVKHSAGTPEDEVLCTLDGGEMGVRIKVSNRATLASGFDLMRIPGGVSGLGLVRALLPRRSARLTLEQNGDRVVAEMVLQPPVVTRG
ncbi:MAG: PAS domain S-box protein [Burkholderiales bacterium]|nr:PAS domain S-box protein [Burkholderiales bacterium]